MLDQRLRPLKDRIVNPLAHALRGVPAAAITLASGFWGLGAAVLTALHHPALAVALWLLNRLLDGLDGAVARLQGAATDRGGYLDIVVDTVVYAALPIGVAVGAGTAEAFLAAAVLLAALYVNGTTWMFLAAILEKRAAGGKAKGEVTTVTMPAGVVEGTEAVLLYSLLLALPAWATPLLWSFAALVALTALLRFARAFRQL